MPRRLSLIVDTELELKVQKNSYFRFIIIITKKVDTSHYDSTVYPPLENVPRRYAILRRNRCMVDASGVIIAAVDHGWGGAAQTLQYAVSKKKTIINFSVWEP